MGINVSKSNYHHGDLRRALTDAALEIIAEKDIESLSLREVARRVGVSHTAPYRHFPDKDALVAAVAQEGFEALKGELEAALQAHPSQPITQLQATGIAYVKYAITHRSHYRIMFGVYINCAEERFPSLYQVAMQTLQVPYDAIVAGQAAGLIKMTDPKKLTWTVWSIVHGLATLLMDQQIPVSNAIAVDELATFVTQSLIEGITIKQ